MGRWPRNTHRLQVRIQVEIGLSLFSVMYASNAAKSADTKGLYQMSSVAAWLGRPCSTRPPMRLRYIVSNIVLDTTLDPVHVRSEKSAVCVPWGGVHNPPLGGIPYPSS